MVVGPDLSSQPHLEDVNRVSRGQKELWPFAGSALASDTETYYQNGNGRVARRVADGIRLAQAKQPACRKCRRGRVWTWTKISHVSLFHVHRPANLPGTTSPDSLENFVPISTCPSVERLIVFARHIFDARDISFMLREPGHFRVVRRGGISRHQISTRSMGVEGST